MSHYKPYPAYCPSGVEWIGDVPSTWEVKRLRQVASFKNSGIDKKSYEGQEQVSLCNYTDVYYNEFITADMPFMQATASKDEILQFTLKKGDLIITKDSEDPSDIGIPALVVEDAPGVVCGYHLTLIRAAEIDAARLLHRALQSPPTHAYFYVESPGITRYGLGQDVIGDLRICVPPKSEIGRIADCTDRETKRIDSLIAKKTRFIDLLKEKRQALITHAVTKGLDPHVKTRDSGDDWIKEIPVTWKSMKFGRIARVTEGLVDPRDEPYRSMVLIAPNHIESGTGRLIQLETAAEQNAESGKYQCRAGNVVYSKIRPALAKVVIAPCDGLCSADMYPLDCTELVEPEWLFYLMLSTSFTAWAILESDRVAMPKINRESLFELGVHVPPKDEQRRVVAFISASVLKSDALLSKTQHSIDLLKERRFAFITAAVTGQIDLREAT
ncbi:MAG: hypothetical protein ACD_23C00755G0003 [uncultured bacterium]|jgi:type I restriction enzyme S subunit|nr:MAG: hypothetical protein ACD_23C00755G0003 [uncultured bacterium]